MQFLLVFLLTSNDVVSKRVVLQYLLVLSGEQYSVGHV